MQTLTHLVYASTATRQFAAEELVNLLSHSRANNARLDITGILLHDRGSFFQVLEGDQDRIRMLFDRIRQDPRHQHTVKIIEEPIAQRNFGAWSMGFAELSDAHWTRVDGMNDFFTQGLVLTQLNAGRAKKLLTAFRQGRWHEGAPAGQPLSTP